VRLPKPLHKFLAKAEWQGTALKFHVLAKTFEDAQLRAERQVKKMEGRDTILNISIIGMLT
jgi:hypothetical protein